MTGVNILLLQQVQAVSPAQPVYVNNWMERLQYGEDSYPVCVGSSSADIGRRNREEELQEVGRELAQPLINGNRVMMTILEISVTSGMEGNEVQIVGFFDDGWNCSIIKNDLAKRLGLWGSPVTLELGTVNATTAMETMLYCVELLDREGVRHLVKAFGLDSLSGPLPTITLGGIKHEFSVAVRENWEKLSRPEGEIELLIGSEVAHLHPVHYETVGRMVVKTTIFGSGWVLNGAHENIECEQVMFDRTVQIIRGGSFRSNRITVQYSQKVKYQSREELAFTLSEKQFMAGEALGVEPPRRCSDCRGCQECTFMGTQMSQEQALELKMMEDSMWFDENIGKWRVSYPFLQDPKVLSNNYRRVLKMAENLEKRLAKVGIASERLLTSSGWWAMLAHTAS